MGFTRFTKNVLNVSALPDRVQNQAQTLKATFDQAGVDIKTALNALIAELEASTSADNIGADVQSVATKTVQAILTAFEEEIANRYTKVEAETLLAIGTNDLVADIDVNLTTGVITITKKDGTVETFDTAIEKVPAKFEIVQTGDTYALKITNVDGTSTQADITNFMNIYNFNNSDNITFEVTGTGTEKTVTANLKANSIGLDKLSLSVVSTLEGYMTSARDSANAAKTSETNAKTSELSALEAKSSAEKSAEDAEYWAKIAQENGGSGGGGITELPIATADTLGGIKVGEGLSITEDGVLSAEGGGSSELPTTMLWEGEAKTVGEILTLSDSIENYDFVYIETGYFTSSNTKRVISPTILKVETIKKNGYGEIVKYCGGHTNSGSGVYAQANFNFLSDTTVKYAEKYETTQGAAKDTGIFCVVGVKNSVKVLDGAVDIDDTPTKGSENVITSGGVFEAIDSLPYKVLEASTDNVIDFNTLTEPGVYLIKNCDNARTTLNGVYSSGTYGIDTLLVVRWLRNANGELYSLHQKCIVATNTAAGDYKRVYAVSNDSWGEWERKLSVTATSLTNSLVRNIKASTTDLTAGTSTLTTGDIYLVYE